MQNPNETDSDSISPAKKVHRPQKGVADLSLSAAIGQKTKYFLEKAKEGTRNRASNTA